MSVQIIHSGIILPSGQNVNPNLLLNSARTVSHLESGTEYIAVNFGQSYVNIPNNTQVTLSFDITVRYTTESTYFLVYNTNNKGPRQFGNVNIGSKLYGDQTVGTTFTKRMAATSTIIVRESPTNNNNYIEFYSNYNTGNVFSVSNFKLELGDKATPWCPNQDDNWGYDDFSTYGFGEVGDTMKIFSNHIETSEFMEY